MIDAHCHLYEIPEEEWNDNGLEAMICCGSGTKNSVESVEMTQKHKNVYAAVGAHPEDMNGVDLEVLRNLTKKQKVVAVGECGLDYTDETSESERIKQRNLFVLNIELARETNLPLVVHCRNAFEDVFELLNYDKVQMHCFTGDIPLMKESVKRGWYISFGGIVTFKKSEALREVARMVPKDRILVETDAPYLAPEPVRGSKNVPDNIKYIIACLAEVRGFSEEQMDQITSENARRLFAKMKTI
jgi:TatD DNase family protein